MTHEETIFAEALGKASAEERSNYLDQVCAGNADLRRNVEALLSADQKARGILESSPVGVEVTADTSSKSMTLTTIGPYKLLEQIGGGGMGVVYMAEQLHPVRRKVALKIIKPGMDSGQVIARFEAERQALTMMDHPNIAKVLDAGTTSAGRPYFVMELVKGIPITDYCDEARLTTRERLELFMQVCHAVQHAHQKGVIHRDLKPSNVLVTLHDDKPVPKVIDFGIAKAAGHLLTDKTLFTNYAQMLGTPLYMSPEQAQISGLDVDTRSDVYSLGVLLYELLTGTTPFDKQRLREAAYDEMRRIIREEDPPNPSTRLSTMGAQITAVSAHRHTEPKKLGQLVRGELDWIVMKAMEKDRARRYETANGLARDVERHLKDEAVQACPPSGLYRFRKFARRNKAALLVASAGLCALLILVVGLAVSNRLIAAERNQTALALIQAQEQSKRADQNFTRAAIAIRGVLTKAAMGLGEWSQLPAPLRKLFSQEAVAFYQSELHEGSTDPDLRYETALGIRAIGSLYVISSEPKQAEDSFRRSVAMLEQLVTEYPTAAKYRHQLAWSLFNLGRALRTGGKTKEAQGTFESGAALYEKLRTEDPAMPSYRSELANCYRELSAIHRQAGDRKREEELLTRSIALLTLPTTQPNDALDRGQLGPMHVALGRIRAAERQVEEAEAEFRTAIKLSGFHTLPTFPSLYGYMDCYIAIIELPGQGGPVERAEQAYKELDQFLAGVTPELRDDPRIGDQMARAQAILARNLLDAGRLDDSVQMFRKWIATLEKLITFKPDSGTPPALLFWYKGKDPGLTARRTHREIARVLVLLNKPAEAETELRKAIEMHEDRAARIPDRRANSSEWAACYFDLARIQIKANHLQDAIPLVTRGVEIEGAKDGKADPQLGALRMAELIDEAGDSEAALASYSEIIAAKPDTVEAWRARGLLYRKRNDPKQSAADFAAAGELCKRQFSDTPTVQCLLDFVECCKLIIDLPADQGLLDRAELAYQELDRLVSSAPQNVRYDPWVSQQMAHAQRLWASRLGEAGRLDESYALLHKALVRFEQLTTGKPESATQPADYPGLNTSLHFAADTHRRIGLVLLLQHKPEDAEREFRRAIEIHEQRTAQFPEAFDRGELQASYFDLARMLIKAHRQQDAVSLVARGIQIGSKSGGEVDSQMVALRLAALLNESGDFEGALAKFSEAISAKPDMVDAWIARGWFYENRGEQQKAEADFTRAIELKPKRSECWTGRAFSHFHRQQWEPAIADFSKAIELDPRVHTHWYHRGHAYIALARWDKAAADFTIVVERWRDDVWGWYFRAQINAQMHRPEEAVADLRKAAAKGLNIVDGMKTDGRFEPIRTNDAFKKLLAELDIRFRPPLDTVKGAEYLRNAGEVGQAIKVCSEILAREPGNDAAWQERANCYLRKSAFAKAAEDFSEAIKLKPDNWWFWHERGYCYLMLGQHENSIADHSRSIELNDHDASQHLRRGHCYRALGQFQKAEEDYSRAIEFEPGYWDNWLARARLYSQQHEAEKARSDLASMMKLPMDPGAQNSVAWALATDSDESWRSPGLALELAEKAIAARPRDGRIWNTVGAARYRNGQWKQAIVGFEKSMEFRSGGDSNDWFFMAMCHWQLGDKDAARKRYDQAVAWMDKNAPKNRELRRFRTEAEQLLKVPSSIPATTPQSN